MPTASQPPNAPSTEDVYMAGSWEESSPRERHPLPRWRLPLMLFLATCVSTFFAGATRSIPAVWNGNGFKLASFDDLELRWAILSQWRDGVTYMVCVLAILLAHEFGHFIATRWYRIRATWPLFLPMPFSPFGTLGAVIMMDHRQADRRQIFDIGLAGPLAGLVVAIPLMAWGIHDLKLDAAPAGLTIDLPLLSRWFLALLQPNFRMETGLTINQASPMFLAAWVGFVVTGLNMLPVSQLDGGHVTYALFGRRSEYIGWTFMTVAILIIAQWFSLYFMWSVMTVLVLLMGVAHPPTANDDVPLGPGRTLLGLISLLIPVLTFAPQMLY